MALATSFLSLSTDFVQVVYFLMNIHLLPRSIYLTRVRSVLPPSDPLFRFFFQHGESEYNRIGRLGGDSPLSENGIQYAVKLREYFEVIIGFNGSKFIFGIFSTKTSATCEFGVPRRSALPKLQTFSRT